MAWIFLAIGLVVLIGGGELLVRGATQLAQRFGMQPMLIGLTVVAFGTSAPELAASLSAAFKGVPEIALGNVVGSNIANAGLVLGCVALIRAVACDASLFQREMPVMIGATALPILMFWDGVQTRFESVGLLVLLAGYMVVLIREARNDKKTAEALSDEVSEELPPPASAGVAIATTLMGVVGLAGGASLLVDGAIDIATQFGVPNDVIGLTLVAIGTSLPELAASAVAAWRGHNALVMGNIVGSNIFNVLAILGTTGVVKPLDVGDAASQIDQVVALAFALGLFLLMSIQKNVSRLGGAILLSAYLGYMLWLFFRPGATFGG